MAVQALRTSDKPPKSAGPKDLYELGEIPPLGHVPEKMYAWAIRKERHGPPEEAMQLEVVPTWPIGDDEVLVLVMAAGVNYNGVWAALGQPISPFDVHKQPYHVAGSDASGIVWAVGAKVKRWKVGDEVVVHCNQDDGDDEECNGGDPMFSPSQRIWGYETPDGSFAQFCRVQSRQLMARPHHLTWEESACYTLTLATAYRMLFGHAAAHRLRPGDNVLVWGASGRARRLRRAALRGLRRQRHRHHLGRSRSATTSCSSARKGAINRKDFNCWGQLPKVNSPEYNEWTKEARKFGKAIWDITGKKDVDIVFEHPGEQTFPVSTLVVKRGGMVVFCAGTSGFNITFDARYRLDAAEAHPGLALRPPQAGGGREPVRHRPPHRPVHVRGLPLGEDPARPHQDVEEPARARQHGGAGQRAAHGPADVRRCHRGRGLKMGVKAA